MLLEELVAVINEAFIQIWEYTKDGDSVMRLGTTLMDDGGLPEEAEQYADYKVMDMYPSNDAVYGAMLVICIEEE